MTEKRQLTDKQRAFCNEYLIDFNSTQAAIRSGYSEKTARSQGQRLLTNVDIQEYLSVLKDERAERVKISQDDVVRELQHIAFDDIKNYLDFKTEKVKVGTDSNGVPVYDYKVVVDIKDSSDIDTRNIQEISLGANGTFKFKLYSKDEALQQLGRHLGIFQDKVEVTDGSLDAKQAYERAAEAIKSKRG